MTKTTRSEQQIRSLADTERLEKTPWAELVRSRSIYRLFEATAACRAERPASTMMPSAALDDTPVACTRSGLLA